MNATRLTEDRSDQVEVVDRMVQNLVPRKIREKLPEVPGRVDVHAHLDVGDFAQDAAIERVAQGQHVGAETKLEIDRRHERPPAAGCDDATCLAKVATHRLLEQNGGSSRQSFEDF